MITPEDTNDLRVAYFELVEARPAYGRAAAFYEGSVEEIYSSLKVKRLLKKFGLDAIESFNFSHIPVDTIANKLRLNSITADKQDNEVGELEKNDTVNSVIEELVEYNEFEEELPQLIRNVGKYGDYYMMVWPVVGEEEEDDRPSTVSKGFDSTITAQSLVTGEMLIEDNRVEVPVGKKSIVAVDMMMLDPMTTRVFYDPENPRKKKFAIRSWVEGEKNGHIVRVNLYYKDRIERWMHKGRPSRRKESVSKWEHFTADGSDWQLPNPFDEVPFFHFRTERTYGRPDHINAFGPQLAINKLVISHLATVDYQSFPQRYALTDPQVDQAGFGGADSDPFAPEDGTGQDPDSDENETSLEADAGAVWLMHGIKNAGQFQAADPDAFLKPFDRYVKALAQVTDTPFHYFDRTGERPPSGENIRQVNETLNSNARARQTGIGSELRKSVTLALNMLGHDVERVNVIWEPIENVTSLVEWQAITEKQTAGVPPEVTHIEAGYLPHVVAEWKRKAEEQAELERQQAIEDEERKIDAAKQAKVEVTEANQRAKAKESKTADKPKPKPSDMAKKK